MTAAGAPRPVAVIGLGVISRFYLAALEQAPGLRAAAVCDLEEAALAPARAAGLPAHRDHRALLAAHPELAGVIVTVPNDAHFALCRDLLTAGLPVCVEKPLATRSADARALAALAAERRVPLLTAFHRRYNAEAIRLAAGCLGRTITKVTVRYLERIEEHVGRDRWYLDPARCGGGCVADNGPNAFDLVRLLLGEVTVDAARIDRDTTGLDRQAVIELTATTPTAAGPAARARVELDWSYDGECKDVEVELADGTVHRADLLAGHHGFKASLWHEYRGILAAFETALADPAAHQDGGIAALDLVEASYRLDHDALEVR
ncbi:Gfo/Idh/MocA family protein [Kitasatospora sp. NPDC052896]|uniref:Gfo/Idh/MocA family protein n=1 Tax=Kitasatospora sp. NPDC052896 TaxID=3364061 RepID=UPI0037C987FD